MKTRFITLMIAVFTTAIGCSAQNYSVRATSYDISDNLDLEAVSYLFGESRDLQEFEDRLNDQRNPISNLDLNNDGYVDYLRVVEQYDYGMHLITIQAVLDRNIFQDVATIDVERNNGSYYVQVVGDPYLYGPNYIIEPAYVRAPIIFTWFLRPNYVVWHSPYYWGYYPNRYHYYRCVPTYRYHRNLYVNVNYRVNTYHYVDYRRSPRAIEMQRSVHRNDYGQRHPDNSFSSRNKGYTNKYEMRSRQTEPGQRRTVTGDSRPATNQSRNYNNSRSTDSNYNKSSRQSTTQPSNNQQKRSYENNKSQGQQGNSSYSKPSTSNNSGYQRNQGRSSNNSGSTNNQNSQKQVKSSSSSNQNNSGYRSSQSTQNQPSNTRSSNSSVRQSSRTPQQTATKSASSKRAQESSSNNSNSKRSETKSKRSSERSR